MTIDRLFEIHFGFVVTPRAKRNRNLLKTASESIPGSRSGGKVQSESIVQMMGLNVAANPVLSAAPSPLLFS